MKISKATKNDLEEIIDFFDKNLEKEEMINKEFLCPFGIKGAINRDEIILLKDEKNIIGAVRFYKRKKSEIVSLYQFAFGKSIKNKKVLQKMLEFIHGEIFETECFKNSKLEKYLQNQDWKLFKEKENINVYRFNF